MIKYFMECLLQKYSMGESELFMWYVDIQVSHTIILLVSLNNIIVLNSHDGAVAVRWPYNPQVKSPRGNFSLFLAFIHE